MSPLSRIASLLLIALAAANHMPGQNLAPLYTQYKNGQLGQVLMATERLLREQPDNPEINQLHGRALVEMGRFKEAIPHLQKAIAKDQPPTWISGWSKLYLGEALFFVDDYEGARRALVECVAQNTSDTVVRGAQRFQLSIGQTPYFNNWIHRETEHFRFHIQPPMDEATVKRFIELREQAFVENSVALGGVTPPKRVDFFVWANHIEPMEKFQLSVGQAEPWKSIVYSARETSPGHELTHVLVHHLAHGEQRNVSGLINEGIAIFLDGNPRKDAELLKTYMARRQIDSIQVRKVWEQWKKYPDEFSYPLAGAFVGDLIAKFGMPKFRQLLINQSFDNAKLIYGDALDIFISEFEARFAAQRPFEQASGPTPEIR